MGDLIFGGLIIILYGSIIFKLIYNLKHTGHACACSHCPMDLMDDKGKIDLLSEIEKEG